MNRSEVSWQDDEFLTEWMRSVEAVHPCIEMENDSMINVTRPQTKGNNTIKGVQFLSPRHCPKGSPLKLKITEVTTNEPDNFGNPVVIYFQDAANVRYSKGFTLNSSILADICDLLGNDEAKWSNKILTVVTEQSKRGGEQLKFTK